MMFMRKYHHAKNLPGIMTCRLFIFIESKIRLKLSAKCIYFIMFLKSSSGILCSLTVCRVVYSSSFEELAAS